MGKTNTENKKPGVMIYFEILPQLGMLKPMQRLAIYDAIMAYGKDRMEPELKREAALAWGFIRPILDRDDERYWSQVEKSIRGGKNSAEKRKRELERAREQEDSSVTDRNQPNSTKGNQSQPEVNQSQPEVNQSQHNQPIYNLQSPNINLQSSDVNLHLQSPKEGDEEKKMHHSRDEVRDYIREKGLAVDPDDFWEYYSVRGWQLSGEPIRDWKILAHRWDRRVCQEGSGCEL